MAQAAMVEGCFAVNKPQGISSAQVLRNLQTHFDPSTLFAPWLEAEKIKRNRENPRRRGKQRLQVKLGHGGTLDPIATGVLITGVGRGTKDLQQFLECTKTYEAVVLFGAATDTYDRVGKVIGRAPFRHITRELVEEALKRFRGKIMQRPPLFSALRVQGKRLYEYARSGKPVPVEIQERPVEVFQLDLIDWMEGGTHEHQWPLAEAEKEEKDVAAQVLHLERVEPVQGDQQPSVDPSTIVAGTEHSPSSIQGTKRKRNEEVEGDEIGAESAGIADMATAKSKKLRPPEDESLEIVLEDKGAGDDPAEPAMSGALPPSSADASSSEPLTSPPAMKIRLTCSSGFYVRSLCHDLGEAVGSLGLMSELVRTRQASFAIGDNVLEYSDLARGESAWGPIVSGLLLDWRRSNGLLNTGVGSDVVKESEVSNPVAEARD
ncbi:MAG: hypothetical protein M1833_001489 [Piccolia ochrophora]|nr:MAG: hypothetical protein M1833_001489 [Piccolia ochrophora]